MKLHIQTHVGGNHIVTLIKVINYYQQLHVHLLNNRHTICTDTYFITSSRVANIWSHDSTVILVTCS